MTTYDVTTRRGRAAIGRTGNRERSLHAPVLSPSRMGDVNRSRVLQALCDMGPLTRADLARLANVPRATISGIVKPLLDSGLVEEGAPDRAVSRAGKPGRPLWFRAGAGLSAAIALRADGCEAALISARGEILAHDSAELSDANDVRAVHRDLIAALKKVQHGAKDILGVGIAVPGVCDSNAGIVLGSSQIPALGGHALGIELARKLDARVVVDNDSRAQALGEKWFGDGRGFRHFAAIQTGPGLGVGLVMNGQVFRGEDGRVGEIGHMPVSSNGVRCRCGLFGCWETIATLPWVRAEAKKLKLPKVNLIDAQSLVKLGAAGSTEAVELLDRYAENLSLGLAVLAQLANPGRIILHGDVVGGGEAFRAAIEQRTRARCLPHLRADVDIVLSSLDQRAGLLGAAGLVLSDTFNLAT